MTADAYYQAAKTLLAQHPEHTDAAIPLLVQAAEQGHALAALEAARHFLEENSPHYERRQGIAMLKIAAEQGHPYARYNLLCIHELEGAQPAQLLDGYRSLAEEGLVEAQIKLMNLCHRSGYFEESMHWAKTAARQQHPQAFYFLAQYCQNAAEPDPQEAHRLYHAAAEQNLAAAHWQLGLQYRFGQGTEPDFAKAVEHLRIAAQQECEPAYGILAELLFEYDSEEAVYWLHRAAEVNDDDAHAALAEIYLQGKHTERNPERAYHHAQTAAANHHPEGLRLMGDFYRYGITVASDRKKAHDFYQKAAEAGSMAAHQKLMSESALSNPEQYRNIKDSALKRQQAEQCYQKAQALHYGLQCKPDLQAALRLYHEAAELGHSKAQTNLGSMYYFGQGTATDYAESYKWFQKAAAQQDSMALYNLACFHYQGTGVPRDIEQACRYLQQAIAGGHEQKDTLQQLLVQWQSSR